MKKCLISLVSVCLLIAASAKADDDPCVLGGNNINKITVTTTGTAGGNTKDGFTIDFPNYVPKDPNYELTSWVLTLTMNVNAQLFSGLYDCPDNGVSGGAVWDFTISLGDETYTFNYGALATDINQGEWDDFGEFVGGQPYGWFTDWKEHDQVEVTFSGKTAPDYLEFYLNWANNLDSAAIISSQGIDFMVADGNRIETSIPGGINYFLVATYIDKTNLSPEPATVLVLLGGLGALPLVRRFRKS